jgi:prevent-host-death family protein
MLELGAEAARKRFPELLERARAGEQSVITNHRVPIAAIVPLDQRVPEDGEDILTLKGSGAGLWQEGPASWVAALRDEWP